MPRDPIVELEWEDSALAVGWHPRSIHELQPSVITSIGFLIAEGPDAVSISTSTAANGDIVDPLTIPRRSIRWMRTVETTEKG